MKQKFYSLLLTALLGMTGMNAWAQLSTTTIDGKTYYQIAFAEDLAEFASLVNGGETTANAVLTDDIDLNGIEWTPIGNATNVYTGTFDGGGFTISKFSLSTTSDNSGLFGKIGSGAVVKNFTIDGSITSNNHQYVGGVVGCSDGAVTISNIHSKVDITCSKSRHGGVLGYQSNTGTININNCTYSGTLTVTGNVSGNFGGIVGLTQNDASAVVNITNCLFDGKIDDGTGANAGGIVGYSNKTKVTIKDCLSIGTITATKPGQFIGQLNASNSKWAGNNYYVDGSLIGQPGSGVTMSGTAPEKVTDAQLASGEIAYTLNGNSSTDVNWFQKIKNTVFAAQQYIVTVNGTPRDPQTANATMTEDANGTYTFMLPNFVVHTNSADIPAGDVKLEGVTIKNDGTFEETGEFSVPDENLTAAGLIALKSSLQNIGYTLSGKVNGDKLYATITGLSIDLSLYGLGTYNISVEIGEDNFTAEAPTGDAYPLPYGTDIVYANGSFLCDGVTPKEGSTVVYSNTDASIVDPHTFADGFCTYCGAIDATYLTANADGFFELGTANQLKWFAVYVNQVDPAVDAILTADIDLSSIAWVPIGNASAKYTGTFDGQGHAITNFTYIATSDHNGLFGYIDGEAIIKNFRISGTLTSDGYTYNGLVGQAEGDSKVSGIYSNMNINVSNFKAHSGGIVGGCTTASKILVEKCEYAGTLTHSGAGDCQAGILGYTYQGGVKNCIFSGTIIGQNNKYGGILGYCKAPAFQGIQNCLSIGKIVADEGCTTAAAIIANWNGNATSNVKNNYYCLAEGSSTTIAIGNKTANCEAPVEVDATQLASGEVAAKLGIAFRQNIGTDATPVLDPTHNVVAEITAAGYATLYVPDADVTIPAGVTAYTGEFATNPNNNEQYLALNAVSGFIPAQTAVVLKGAEDIYEFAYSAPVPDGALGVYKDEVDGSEALVKGWAAPIEGNVLKGAAEDIDAAGKYVLAKPEGMDVCFYQAESGIIKAGKAYLEVPAGTDVKAIQFLFPDDDPTGISDLNGQWSMVNGQSIYNLAGQRVGKMQKGVNVVNGKKVLY